MGPADRDRAPLPAGLTVAERALFSELRRLAGLAGFTSRGLERETAAASLGFGSRSQWDRWLGGRSRPPLQAVTALAGLLARDGFDAGHLRSLWNRAFAPAGAPGPGAGPAVRPAQLPPAAPHFTGRAAELGVLAGLAAQAAVAGEPVVVAVIAGTAGVGKTALAVHGAHQVAGQFPDGQLYVNLRGYDPSAAPADPADALQGFLDALGVPADQRPAGLEARAGLYRSLLAGRQVLVVLDNAREPDQVRPLLPGTPGSLVLVTSRSQLTGLAADGARLMRLDVLCDDEARSLLARRLGAGRAEAESAAVTELVTLCARLPLALNVAAARAAAQPALTLAGLAADLRGESARLDALDTGEAATSARTVFSWSYQSLGPAAALMFRLLSQHSGPDITVAAAASLAAVPAGQARRALGELAAAHLLAERAPGRYAFHDLLRAYAAERAAACDSHGARLGAAARVLDHYLHSAHAAAVLMCPGRDLLALAPPRPGVTPEEPADSAAALAWFTAERAVLASAVTFAAGAGLGAAAWQLGWTTGRYLHRGGYRQEWIATLQVALAAAEDLGDPAARAYVHRDLGAAYAEQGSAADAEPHLRQALGLYAELGDAAGQAHAELYLGRACELRGQRRDALDCAVRALALFRAAGHAAGQANALTNAGSCHAALGEHGQALACFQQALPLHRDSGNRDGECYAWAGLGDTWHHLGQHARAIDCDQRSIAMFRELGSRRLAATVLTQLGDHLLAGGQRHDARAAWQKALAILDDLEHPAAAEVRRRLAQAAPAVV